MAVFPEPRNTSGEVPASHLDTALARGHSLSIEAISSHHDLFGWIHPEADLDGTFEMTCEDTGELLAVNGWLFSVAYPAAVATQDGQP